MYASHTSTVLLGLQVGESTIKYHPNGLTHTVNAITYAKWKTHFDKARSTRSPQFSDIEI